MEILYSKMKEFTEGLFLIYLTRSLRDCRKSDLRKGFKVIVQSPKVLLVSRTVTALDIVDPSLYYENVGSQ